MLEGLNAFVPEAQRRQGGAGDDEDDVEELTTRYFELQKMFRQRLYKAEMGNWDGLLQEYVQELEKKQVNGEGILAADLSWLLPQAQEDEDAMVSARPSPCWRAAPPTAATNEEIANLAATGIDEAEREQTKLQLDVRCEGHGEVWGSPSNHCQGCGEKAQHGGSGGPQPDHEPRYHGGGEVAGWAQTACTMGGDLVERIRVPQHHQALDGGQDGGARRRVGETSSR